MVHNSFLRTPRLRALAALATLIAVVCAIVLPATRPTPARAQAQTDFSVNWSISSAEPVALGKVNDLVFDAVAADDGVRITLEDSNPLIANPPAQGLWTGFTDVGSVNQHAGVTFTAAVPTTVTGQLKLEKNGEVVYLQVAKTFNVLPVTHGLVKIIQFNPVVAGMIARFSAVATNETGPASWRAFVMNLDCDGGYVLHNFQVNVPTSQSQDIQGDFNAMMPPTADHCTWTGSGMANGVLFSFSPLAFDVHPLWEYTLNAPLSATASTSITATVGVQFNGLLPLCGCAEYQLIPVFNDVEQQVLPINQVDIITVGPLRAGPNVLKLIVQYRPNEQSAWDTISSSEQVTITGTPVVEPGLTSRSYIPLALAGSR